MKCIVFIYDYPYFYEAIKKLCANYYKILIVGKKQFEYNENNTNLFNEIITVNDIFNIEEVDHCFKGMIKHHNVSNIITGFELTVEVAGYLRSKYGILGMNASTCELFRNKFIMKQRVHDYKIKTNKVKIVTTVHDVNEALKEFDYPFILKPISGAGTMRTMKISKDSDLQDFMVNYSKNSILNEKFIIEEYIYGEEYHCDSIVYNGKVCFATVSKYLENCLDAMNKEGSGIGSILFPEDYSKNGLNHDILKANEKIIKAFGVDKAVCHAEFFVTEYGDIIFGEIAARVGGGPLISSVIYHSYGVDLNEVFIMLELGFLDINPMCVKKFSGFITFESKEGEIADISSEEELNLLDCCVFAVINKKKGDTISKRLSSTSRVGFIVMEHDNYYKLYKKMILARESFHLVMK